MKTLVFATLAIVLSFSTNSFAKDTTVDSLLCYVHVNGHYTQTIWGKNFFSAVSAYSRRKDVNRCVIAKIYNDPRTSRLYIDGRRPISSDRGMTTEEIQMFVNPNMCTVFSCERSIL